MELNNNKKAEIPSGRITDMKKASEARNAELRQTVERVRDSSSQIEEQSRAIGRHSDSIELSAGASRGIATESDAAREVRLQELKEAAADGSLFNRDRLARAAERLLASDA